MYSHAYSTIVLLFKIGAASDIAVKYFKDILKADGMKLVFETFVKSVHI